ncbi:acyl-CoA/acyl-ACP dehydrogenase [Amycolatopsis acidiphila]|uniref:Acyl-CoA dehydrogenase n=1 Tax=Amycolatopsis acidiphila TaxID=715473 RepID=A0A558AHZ4_9PSEU|nr:acyl-CoA dehydrogenase family protein [Amycolatopsis acidiphila]TVT23885.1 acyl-CoA dehydrogenase [Amycolatopsis acidiphila]UIJ61139.1 acyl-CoA/acyl-ACP dehydrogenase [Amycolatopsis acidiphila]GHG86482.1 acyl-CoA dehydrogenase [Amycolatopsis acidiphila]
MSELAADLRDLVGDLVARTTDGGTPAAALRLWERARELGLPQVGVPEEFGGSGGTLSDLLVLVHTLGTHGIGLPIVEASVADWVLGEHRDDSWATIAFAGSSSPTPADRVTGEFPAVPWARNADRLVLCMADDVAVAVDLRHESVIVHAEDNIAGEPRDTVVLAQTPVTPIVGSPPVSAIRDRLALLWSTAVAGAAHGAYRLTKSHVAQRRQFDAPLLKLPAVATNLATMRVHLMQADAALASAGGTADSAGVAIARITTAAAATEIARLAHQLHGAIGITQEHPLHHYTRRLWAWRDALATERDWCAVLGAYASEGGEHEVWTRLTASSTSTVESERCRG